MHERGRRWRVGAAVGGLALVAACGGDDRPTGYGAEHREAFVEDCTTGEVSEHTCGCFYDRLAAQVPFARFEELDAATPEEPPGDLAALAAGCAAGDDGD